ncbi:flavodoxin domain-containing protein [Campylobacter sp. faydin G-24]|uniref:Flavodoxin n=1 Tax=Campylobacter anatolicus TaxID=2829105 RepID=A0ABS5HI55_9BACT|nr:flavodoxin domain-containing protein [Campylobacter anatolicus]MBR8463958.1 flavodoxin domain-containing protein [Campylobacter anatolicus]
MKIGIFYATGKGDTQKVSEYISLKLGGDAIAVKDAVSEDFTKFDVLILASSSYGYAELHADWVDKLAELKKADLKGKKVALVGVGNQERHADSFCGGIVDFLPAIKKATLIGHSVNNDYKFSHSPAFINGKFIGLVLDTKGDSGYTSKIDAWVEQLKTEV